jgi:hypothetical protein
MSEKKLSPPNTRHWLRAFACLVPVMGLGGCVDYVKHGDTISFAAGDAQDWNKVVHTADPWPPYVMNTRIPGDGQRTAKVIQRYSTGNSDGGAAQPATNGAVGGAGSP